MVCGSACLLLVVVAGCGGCGVVCGDTCLLLVVVAGCGGCRADVVLCKVILVDHVTPSLGSSFMLSTLKWLQEKN